MEDIDVAQAGPDADHIRLFAKSQVPTANITNVEHVSLAIAAEFGSDVWSVSTDHTQYWVLTNPLALYRHAQFSADDALTYHLGLLVRQAAEQNDTEDQNDVAAPIDSERSMDPLRAARQTLDQLDAALAVATSDDEYQAIGWQCQEALLALLLTIDGGFTNQTDTDHLATALTGWPDRIAHVLIGKQRMPAIQDYLAALVREIWQLTDWIKGGAGLTFEDGQLVLGATKHALHMLELGAAQHAQLAKAQS